MELGDFVLGEGKLSGGLGDLVLEAFGVGLCGEEAVLEVDD